MKVWQFGAAAMVALASGATIAQTQTAPISRTIPVTFTGVVSSTAADTILVRQPDGSMATFSGPLPPMPYAQGDPVTVSFNATLPTKAFYDSGLYQGQIAADGIYRIGLSSISFTSNLPGGIGNSSNPDVSGPINPVLNFGQPTNTRMTIVYDYNSDSYSIEGGGNFASGAYSSPGYIYDAASGAYVACSNDQTCRALGSNDPVLSVFSAGTGNSATTIQSGNFRINSTDPSSGTGTGFFSWLFSGSWNLPQFNGGATAVPEPGMLGMFGGGFAALIWRRRRRKSARTA